MPNEREDYLAEDNAVARECFKVLSPEAREAMTAGDICVLVGLAAEARRRGVKRYRAELTAPAEGDVGVADDRTQAENLLTEVYRNENEPRIDNVERIITALTTARKDAQARVEALEAGLKRIAAALRPTKADWLDTKASTHYYSELIRMYNTEWVAKYHLKEYEDELHRRNKIIDDALAALLAGEGKGEEAEREGGAGRDALEEVE